MQLNCRIAQIIQTVFVKVNNTILEGGKRLFDITEVAA